MNHKEEIKRLIQNGYPETHVGYHAEYRNWKGEWVRGCYAQIAAPYGGTIRIYERSYAELLISVREYLAGA
jgi:hypothetical protein